MAGTPFRDGPAFLTTTSDNVYVPGALTYALVRHIHIANSNASARTFSLWVGATDAEANGTELAEAKNCPANDYVDLYFPAGLKLTATDFLVGLSSADATSLAITVMGELYVV